jgi:hypothetical protein
VGSFFAACSATDRSRRDLLRLLRRHGTALRGHQSARPPDASQRLRGVGTERHEDLIQQPRLLIQLDCEEVPQHLLKRRGLVRLERMRDSVGQGRGGHGLRHLIVRVVHLVM